MTEESIKEAELNLQRLDPILGALIAAQKLSPRASHTDYFASLCGSIISQQVSVAAAAAIFARFKEITSLKPETVALLDNVQIKAIGLSKQKTAYLKDLAKHFVKDPNIYNHLERESDERVITELTAVKGIGIWTAQMFLIFTLGRPDVFAPDDVGLQRALLQLYEWEMLPPKIELERRAMQWKPYRTTASLHLWQSLANTPA